MLVCNRKKKKKDCKRVKGSLQATQQAWPTPRRGPITPSDSGTGLCVRLYIYIYIYLSDDGVYITKPVSLPIIITFALLFFPVYMCYIISKRITADHSNDVNDIFCYLKFWHDFYYIMFCLFYRFFDFLLSANSSHMYRLFFFQLLFGMADCNL